MRPTFPLFPKPLMLKKVFVFIGILALLGTPLFDQVEPTRAVPVSRPPVLLGIIQDGWIDQSWVDSQLAPLDAWAGKHTTLVGVNSDFEDSVPYLGIQLDALWNNGYTPYIGLSAGYFSKPTAYDIAAGNRDAALNHWAQVYASWAVGGKFAFISVLPEMNTPYVSYGRDPGNYKLAFAHIRQIFSQNNVPDSAVRWVFEANGWVQLPFEPYYPGNGLVDVVGYSAFNKGFCTSSMDKYWLPPGETVGFSLKEMHAMAPEKPIFITRMGTTALTAKNYSDDAAKNQWLLDAYNMLANDPDVRAVIYYNYPKSSSDCDWAIYQSGSTPIQYTGYRDAVQSSSYGYLSPSQLHGADLSPIRGTNQVYLPQIVAPKSPVLLGAYTQDWPGSQQVMDNEYHALDAWAGKRLSIAGIFIDMFADPLVIEMQLETIWDNGYTPFINLDVLASSNITAKMIANGYADAVLHQVGHMYALMAQYNRQMAYIAPLQEMDGDWVPYGRDPANYKKAYQRIRTIFAEEGVPPESVKWVFAPNGWNEPGSPPFEDYYPGDDQVDILAFSGYNFGYCSFNAYPAWKSPSAVFDDYIHRFMVMSPDKPIFIAQVATTSYTSRGNSNTAAKNQWLADAYAYVLDHPSVRAVIYYNLWDAECDWSFYQLGGKQYSGYQQGVSQPSYGYVSPFVLKSLDFPVP